MVKISQIISENRPNFYNFRRYLFLLNIIFARLNLMSWAYENNIFL